MGKSGGSHAGIRSGNNCNKCGHRERCNVTRLASAVPTCVRANWCSGKNAHEGDALTGAGVKWRSTCSFPRVHRLIKIANSFFFSIAKATNLGVMGHANCMGHNSF